MMIKQISFEAGRVKSKSPLRIWCFSVNEKLNYIFNIYLFQIRRRAAASSWSHYVRTKRIVQHIKFTKGRDAGVTFTKSINHEQWFWFPQPLFKPPLKNTNGAFSMEMTRTSSHFAIFVAFLQLNESDGPPTAQIEVALYFNAVRQSHPSFSGLGLEKSNPSDSV